MSRVTGRTLETFMRPYHQQVGGRVPPQQVGMIAGMVLRWVRETLPTTTADISCFIRPRNIMIWDASTIRVNTSATELDPAVEAAYVCPEVRTGKPCAVPSRCVWALGALMYHMLTGELPAYTVTDNEVTGWFGWFQIAWADPQRPLMIVVVKEMLWYGIERHDIEYVARVINDYVYKEIRSCHA